MTKANKYWALIIIFLAAIIITGGIITWSRYSPSQPIEISLPQPPELQGEFTLREQLIIPASIP